MRNFPKFFEKWIRIADEENVASLSNLTPFDADLCTSPPWTSCKQISDNFISSPRVAPLHEKFTPLLFLGHGWVRREIRAGCARGSERRAAKSLRFTAHRSGIIWLWALIPDGCLCRPQLNRGSLLLPLIGELGKKAYAYDLWCQQSSRVWKISMRSSWKWKIPHGEMPMRQMERDEKKRKKQNKWDRWRRLARVLRTSVGQKGQWQMKPID